MGLIYRKEPSGWAVELDGRHIGWLIPAQAGWRAILDVPWFTPYQIYPTVFAARIAISDVLVEEEILETYGDSTSASEASA